MTMPNERTRAVLAVGEFLRRLSSAYTKDGIKKIPLAVRAEALALLRHYPIPTDLMFAADNFDSATVEHFLDERDKENSIAQP